MGLSVVLDEIIKGWFGLSDPSQERNPYAGKRMNDFVPFDDDTAVSMDFLGGSMAGGPFSSAAIEEKRAVVPSICIAVDLERYLH